MRITLSVNRVLFGCSWFLQEFWLFLFDLMTINWSKVKENVIVRKSFPEMNPHLPVHLVIAPLLINLNPKNYFSWIFKLNDINRYIWHRKTMFNIFWDSKSLPNTPYKISYHLSSICIMCRKNLYAIFKLSKQHFSQLLTLFSLLPRKTSLEIKEGKVAAVFVWL